MTNKVIIALLIINTLFLTTIFYDKWVRPNFLVPPLIESPLSPKPYVSPTTPVPETKSFTKSAKSLDSVKSFGTYLSGVEIDKVVKAKKDLVIINVADKSSKLFTAADIKRIKDSGKIVLANFSVGYAESYRWYWKQNWTVNPPAWLGEEKDDEKNKYLVRNLLEKEWLHTIFPAIDTLVDLGYDGIVLNGLESYIYMGGAKRLRDNAMEFTIALSSYTKQRNPNFKIFAKNTELLYKNSAYMDAIDGFVKEPLFFSLVPGVKRGADEISKILVDLKNYTEAGKKVLVVEWNAPNSRWPAEYDERLKRNQMLGYNAPNKTQNSIRE